VNRATVWCALLLGLVAAGCGGGAAGGAAAAAGGSAAAADATEGATAATGGAAKAQVAPPVPLDTTLPVEYRREVFRYSGGSRDPFESLLVTGGMGPMIGDLRLVAVTFDARYGNSVAIVRALNVPQPYRVRRGDTIGRMRVIQIRQYEVVFQIEEFGFERQEVLALRRPEVTR
jgi:hypothetical protein